MKYFIIIVLLSILSCSKDKEIVIHESDKIGPIIKADTTRV